MHRSVVVFLIFVMLAGCAGKDSVRRAVREDPSLVMDVLRENRFELLEIMQQALDDQEQLARQQQWLVELDHPYKPVIQGNRPVLGSVIAPVTVVEYSDFFCPYCDRGSRTVHTLLERHPDQIRVVFKHFPLHEGADFLAALFEAVAMQNQEAAWKYKQQVFAESRAVRQEGIDGPTLRTILNELGIDVKKALQDAASDEIRARIAADVQEARSFGFRGTPTYLLDGVAVRGAASLEEFEQVLQLVLKKREGAAECTDCVVP